MKTAPMFCNHKFWDKQPVDQFIGQDKKEKPQGFIKVIEPKDVPTENTPLPAELEWYTPDPIKDLQAIYEFMKDNYIVEDGGLRYQFGSKFIKLLMTFPGHKGTSSDGYMAIREKDTKEIVGLCCGHPERMSVHGIEVDISKRDFGAIGKKHRAKRLVTSLMQEAIRTDNLRGCMAIFYSASKVLHKPFAEAWYYYRPFNPLKIHKVIFHFILACRIPSSC